MGSLPNYSKLSRQSRLGICIIYTHQIGKFLKTSWIFLLLFFKDYADFDSSKKYYIILGVLILFVFLLIRAILIYRNFKFKVDDQYFILNQGIFKKQNTSIPLQRIQNINFKQNVVHQILNIYELHIDTAGTHETEISIKALRKKDAELLKNHIYQLKEDLKPTEKQNEDEIKISISFKNLLKVGLSHNHMKSFVLLLLLFIGFYQQIEQFIDFFGFSSVENVFKGTYNAVVNDILAIVFLFLFIIILSIFYSFMAIVIKHFNLSVVISKTSFEIKQGLFTKQNIILNLSKIQYFRMSTNPLKKWLGLGYMTFVQTDNIKVDNKKLSKLIRIVGLNQHDMEMITDSLDSYESLDVKNSELPDVYYKKRMIGQSFIFLILLGLILSLFTPVIIYSGLIIILALLLWSIISVKYKKRFFQLFEDAIVLNSGVYETHRTYLALFKIQHISMRQSVFQKRKEVVDLVLQTASDKLFIPCVPIARAREIYNFILFKIETEKKPWM